jgi:hypothetical protein
MYSAGETTGRSTGSAGWGEESECGIVVAAIAALGEAADNMVELHWLTLHDYDGIPPNESIDTPTREPIYSKDTHRYSRQWPGAKGREDGRGIHVSAMSQVRCR